MTVALSGKMANVLWPVRLARECDADCVAVLSDLEQIAYKQAWRRVEKAVLKDLAEYGVSQKYAWLTPKGRTALNEWEAAR